jgi:uncharacterized glyoxalase superfamily protein PhnB
LERAPITANNEAMAPEQTNDPPPAGWPRIAPGVFYDNAAAAIDWLCEVLGFQLRMKVEADGGRIVHSELTFGNDSSNLIMVSSSGGRSDCPNPPQRMSPRSLAGANTQALCIYVDDVDHHFQRARAAGARIAEEPKTTDYGPDFWVDRTYRVIDLEGHHWWFMQRMRG